MSSGEKNYTSVQHPMYSIIYYIYPLTQLRFSITTFASVWPKNWTGHLQLRNPTRTKNISARTLCDLTIMRFLQRFSQALCKTVRTVTNKHLFYFIFYADILLYNNHTAYSLGLLPWTFGANVHWSSSAVSLLAPVYRNFLVPPAQDTKMFKTNITHSGESSHCDNNNISVTNYPTQHRWLLCEKCTIWNCMYTVPNFSMITVNA